MARVQKVRLTPRVPPPPPKPRGLRQEAGPKIADSATEASAATEARDGRTTIELVVAETRRAEADGFYTLAGSLNRLEMRLQEVVHALPPVLGSLDDGQLADLLADLLKSLRRDPA